MALGAMLRGTELEPERDGTRVKVDLLIARRRSL